MASETCALDLIGAKYLRDVEPGEMVIVDRKGLRSRQLFEKNKSSSMCIFEYIYFLRRTA